MNLLGRWGGSEIFTKRPLSGWNFRGREQGTIGTVPAGGVLGLCENLGEERPRPVMWLHKHDVQ